MTSLPICPRPWVSEIDVVVLPSPAFVGVIAVVMIELAVGRGRRAARATRERDLRAGRPVGLDLVRLAARPRPRPRRSGEATASCAISSPLFIAGRRPLRSEWPFNQPGRYNAAGTPPNRHWIRDRGSDCAGRYRPARGDGGPGADRTYTGEHGDHRPLRRNVARTRRRGQRGRCARAARTCSRPRSRWRSASAVRARRPSAVAVTMRTPGGDFELAAGFLFTEGLIARPRGGRARHLLRRSRAGRAAYNVVTVELTRSFDAGIGSQRNFYSSSSCGICGKATLDDVEVQCAPVAPGTAGRRLGDRRRCPMRCDGAQRVFEQDRRAARGRRCSTPRGSCSPCARTSGATTRSTRSSASSCSRATCPLSESRPAGLGPGRASRSSRRPRGRHPRDHRGRRPVDAGSRGGRALRHDRSSASCATTASTSTPTPSASAPDPSRPLVRAGTTIPFERWFRIVERIGRAGGHLGKERR